MATYSQFTNGSGRRSVKKSVRDENAVGLYRTVDLGTESYDWVAEIDQEALQYLALKAASNKRGESYAGPVKVRIVKREANKPPLERYCVHWFEADPITSKTTQHWQDFFNLSDADRVMVEKDQLGYEPTLSLIAKLEWHPKCADYNARMVAEGLKPYIAPADTYRKY